MQYISPFYVYNTMNLGRCIKFHHSRSPSTPLWTVPSISSQSLATTDLICILPFPKCRINGILQDVDFQVWFLSLSTTEIYLCSLLLSYSPLCGYTTVYSFTGHKMLGCFQFGVIMDESAISVNISVRYILRTTTVGPKGSKD